MPACMCQLGPARMYQLRGVELSAEYALLQRRCTALVVGMKPVVANQ
jgi:hypothetical protein